VYGTSSKFSSYLQTVFIPGHVLFLFGQLFNAGLNIRDGYRWRYPTKPYSFGSMHPFQTVLSHANDILNGTHDKPPYGKEKGSVHDRPLFFKRADEIYFTRDADVYSYTSPPFIAVRCVYVFRG
jgi:hypothetical protein